jgi:hypothetical protein
LFVETSLINPQRARKKNNSGTGPDSFNVPVAQRKTLLAKDQFYLSRENIAQKINKNTNRMQVPTANSHKKGQAKEYKRILQFIKP